MQPLINEQRQRFEWPLDTEYAYIDYRWYDGYLALMHTSVPVRHRGKDIAARLAAFTLHHIQEQGWKMKLYCPYLLRYIKRHPEFQQLLHTHSQEGTL